MPCRVDTEGIDAEDKRRLKRELDNVTRMLCQLCMRSNPATVMTVPGLSLWWDAHQEADAKRLAAERLAAERDAQRASGLAKLSEEEQVALGLRRKP